MKEANTGVQIRVCEREKASMTETDLLVSRHNDENKVPTLAETVLNGVRDEETTISDTPLTSPVQTPLRSR